MNGLNIQGLRLAAPQSFETAIISTDQFQRLGEDTLDFCQKREHLRAQVSASQAFELSTAAVTEEHLTFNRRVMRFVQAASDTAWVRVIFTPAPR